MGHNNSANKAFIGKASPKIVDTVRFNNRYIDLETVKEKATGIASAIMIFAGIVAFSFLFFI
ncbi:MULTISPECIES: hypothetical protein [unclassified Butyrivibrio]|uniref:hypothetical protein n=1 Tax=unclassified Butyrivibrio TaxID=2639466 RepID=UPI0003B66A26|nr:MULTISPECIES: hypothetical protein [unclassified Butyrivibrio]SDB69496.1 hypothetical protein SAMN02910263_04457 [Butyrivibrio sp. INlla16]SEM10889.1 hypothetical protein SAMN04487770_12610 [Butyrivibrio sp. ob235]